MLPQTPLKRYRYATQFSIVLQMGFEAKVEQMNGRGMEPRSTDWHLSPATEPGMRDSEGIDTGAQRARICRRLLPVYPQPLTVLVLLVR